MIPALWYMSDYLRNDGFKSVVLKADYEGTPNGLNLTLYKDNTFQLLKSGPFGGHYVRGSYKFVQDTLYMDTAKSTNANSAAKFVLRVNEHNEKFFDPITMDTSHHAFLFVTKDILTKK